MTPSKGVRSGGEGRKAHMGHIGRGLHTGIDGRKRACKQTRRPVSMIRCLSHSSTSPL